MISALRVRTHKQVRLQVPLEDRQVTTSALRPQPLGAHRLLRIVDNLVVFPLEPAHPRILCKILAAFATRTAADLLYRDSPAFGAIGLDVFSELL
jgi:hypothetical protein